MSAPEHPRPVTLRAIAQVLGVSHATVSLALRNKTAVPEARRKQIQALAAEMGYTPNVAAATLSSYKARIPKASIGGVLAWLNLWTPPDRLRSYKEFDAYWRGAYAAAEKFGYRLEEFRCDRKTSPTRLQGVLRARGITGVLLPPHAPGTDWSGLRWENLCAVRFGRSIPHPGFHIVTSDHVANTMLAFRKIQSYGYSRIGFVMGNASSRGALFEAGFLMAQTRLEPGLRLPLCFLDEQDREGNGDRLARWMEAVKPEAILTDLSSLKHLLQEAGYRVPQDVGLAGLSILDGNVDAGIDQHPEEIGRVAVLFVVSLIQDQAFGVPPIFRQILISGSWVDGQSMPNRLSGV